MLQIQANIIRHQGIVIFKSKTILRTSPICMSSVLKRLINSSEFLFTLKKILQLSIILKSLFSKLFLHMGILLFNPQSIMLKSLVFFRPYMSISYNSKNIHLTHLTFPFNYNKFRIIVKVGPI